MKSVAYVFAVVALAFVAVTLEAAEVHRWVVYYSDSTFTVPVGKHFVQSNEFCAPPLDEAYYAGTVTNYRITEARDDCSEVWFGTTCTADGEMVPCYSTGTTVRADWDSIPGGPDYIW